MSSRYDVIGPNTLEAIRRDSEIIRLKDRIEKLEAALRDIIDRAEYRMGHHVTDAVCAIARNALERENEDNPS